MTKQELLHQVNEALAGSSEHTIRQFCSIIARFYDFSGGSFTRTQVVNYIKNLEKQGYSPGTRRTHFRVLKRGFEIAHKLDPEIEWTFGKRVPSEVAIADVPWEKTKIAFTSGEIKALIDTAREGKLGKAEKQLRIPIGSLSALVALSTTYGLRRIEMADLDSDALNLETKRLRVFTRHGSRIREHLIPDAIIPYLKHYQPLRSEFKLSQVFHEIEKESGLPERYGTGWHSNRRGLVNTLVDTGLDKMLIYDFMRWKLSVQFGMLGTYFTEAPESVDQKVFEKHPFLDFWI